MLDSWIMKLDLAKLIIIGALVTVASNLYAWEKVPVPDYVNKKTRSPWNFYDNFEDQKLTSRQKASGSRRVSLRSKTSAGGKPSTWLPPGGLVEQEFTSFPILNLNLS